MGCVWGVLTLEDRGQQAFLVSFLSLHWQCGVEEPPDLSLASWHLHWFFLELLKSLESSNGAGVVQAEFGAILQGLS